MLALASCNKKSEVILPTPGVGKPATQNITANYSFNWDDPNTITMPVSASSPTVYVPWRSNGGTPLDAGIVDDYHKADGWDLVFNSFSPDNFPKAGDRGAMATSNGLPAGGLYFALYNRYRGIIRYYTYIPPGLFGGSTQLAHGLSIYGNGSTGLLSFEGTDIVDLDNKATSFTKTNKDGISTTGGWYAMQYQLAYDPLFTSTTFPNPGFRWDCYNVSVSQIKLNGTEIGSLKGTITTPAPDFNWGNVINGALGIAEIFGTAGLANASSDVAKAFAGAAAGGLAGNTTGFLSGIFGGNSANSQTVDLAINSTITTTGTSTSFQPYQLNSTPLPGQNVAGTNGVPPLINYPLGVFNLSGKPTVKLTTTLTEGTPPYEYTNPDSRDTYTNVYDLDYNEINSLLLFNLPAGASYDKLGAEVVLVDPDEVPGFEVVSAQREVIGSHTVYTGVPAVIAYKVQHWDPQPASATSQKVAIRVSFRIKSNNGVPDVFMVKTFLANLVS